MNTFPLNADAASFGSSVTLFVDPQCRVRAQVFDLAGHPIPNAQVGLAGRQIAPFQATQSVLYARDAAGLVETVYPHPAATAPTVTGAKGGNAALASLVSALASLGVIVDQTT